MDKPIIITKEKVERAIKGSNGVVSSIARRLKCSRQTVYERLNEYTYLKEMVDAEREELIDLAETKLAENVRAGLEASIFFTLKTLGKKRGFSERQELDITTGGEKINTIRLIEVKKENESN